MRPPRSQSKGPAKAAGQRPGGRGAAKRPNRRFPESGGVLVSEYEEERRKRRPKPQRQRSIKPRSDVPGEQSPVRVNTTRQNASRFPARSVPLTEVMRIAKAMARAGLCSRREAERWIEDGRVAVNGETLQSPARDVGPRDRIEVDGQPLPAAEPARLWRFHKPKGCVTTHKDPEGRPTVFEKMPPDMPRVISIGRLDFNTEGLLLLTNDGELARHLELPSTGWLRRYRVRAFGTITQKDLDALKDGIVIDGVRYGPIEGTVDQVQGSNVWLTLGLREGKNREVRNILASLQLTVNRLIRISFGPFQLLDLEAGAAEHVKRRVLADQLGPEIAQKFNLVADEDAAPAKPARPPRPKRERD
jgi:23S rRNA pseudouridine2605 synthase